MRCDGDSHLPPVSISNVDIRLAQRMLCMVMLGIAPTHTIHEQYHPEKLEKEEKTKKEKTEKRSLCIIYMYFHSLLFQTPKHARCSTPRSLFSRRSSLPAKFLSPGSHDVLLPNDHVSYLSLHLSIFSIFSLQFILLASIFSPVLQLISIPPSPHPLSVY